MRKIGGKGLDKLMQENIERVERLNAFSPPHSPKDGKHVGLVGDFAPPRAMRRVGVVRDSVTGWPRCHRLGS